MCRSAIPGAGDSVVSLMLACMLCGADRRSRSLRLWTSLVGSFLRSKLMMMVSLIANPIASLRTSRVDGATERPRKKVKVTYKYNEGAY